MYVYVCMYVCMYVCIHTQTQHLPYVGRIIPSRGMKEGQQTTAVSRQPFTKRPEEAFITFRQ